MKKYFFRSLLVAACMLAVLANTACNKDGMVTLNVRLSGFNGSSKVEMGGSQFKTPMWNNGDQVLVNGVPVTVSSATSTGAQIMVPQAAGYWAVYPSDIFTSFSEVDNKIYISTPCLQPYTLTTGNKQLVKAPMGAYLHDGGSSSITFTNLGALLAIAIRNNTGLGNIIVDSVSVKATGIALWGDGFIDHFADDSRRYFITSNQADHDSVVLAGLNPDDEEMRESTSMNLTVSGSEPATVYIYVPSSPLTPNRYKITVFAHVGTDLVITAHEQSEANPNGGSLPLNAMASINFKMAESVFPQGAIDGLFTVFKSGSTIKQVRFSQGNLQYQGSTKTWRFAENQWDFVGGGSVTGTVPNGTSAMSSNAMIGANYAGWIDLFGWGTSGCDGLAMPYNSVANNSSYAYPGSATDIAGTNYDWGKYNKISNGGNTAGLWRTLTKAEWEELLLNRTFFNGQYSGLGYSYKIVRLFYTSSEFIAGLLLFPDGYTNQSSVPDTPTPLYEIPEGCVFLPFAGYRQGTILYSVKSWGYYWSATKNGTASAQIMRFSTDFGQTGIGRYIGSSVRLVQDYVPED
ncbi:MAG: hypothetical protein IKN11_05940 [Bacteroidales bacterium]|nr:hypothetical protein [Bacteroidales bacterium]